MSQTNVFLTSGFIRKHDTEHTRKTNRQATFPPVHHNHHSLDRQQARDRSYARTTVQVAWPIACISPEITTVPRGNLLVKTLKTSEPCIQVLLYTHNRTLVPTRRGRARTKIETQTAAELLTVDETEALTAKVTKSFAAEVAEPDTAVVTEQFNKIAISNIKFQMASGQGSHWLIESPTIFHLCVARPCQISVNCMFKHIHTTSINTIIWQFVPFIYHPL